MHIRNSRGSSNIGCFLTLAIVVCGFYAGYKFAVVQWNLESFKEKLTEITRYWATDGNVENLVVVKNEIIQKAALSHFTLTSDDISINADGQFVNITVSWVEPISFPRYVYNREITISRSIKKRGY